jgi:hypothetical protein
MYLYLKEESHVANWLSGEKIPLKTASTYNKDERNGVYTPDENKIIKIDGDIIKPGIQNAMDNAIRTGGEGIKTTINFDGNVIINNEVIGGNIKYSRKYEDGIILCVSTILSKDLANRFNKQFVIEIKSLNKVIESFNEQLGVEGISGKCNYTSGDERNHFLKHVDDSWQSEYRVFWPDINYETWVKVPSKIGKDKTHMIK